MFVEDGGGGGGDQLPVIGDMSLYFYVDNDKATRHAAVIRP